MRRTILGIAAIFGLLVGLLWVLQGLGIVHWPASSFMLDERPWAIRGAIVMLVSLVVLLGVRKAP